MAKPTLLLISATYVVDENRKKLAHLSEHFELVCVTCTEANSVGFRVTFQENAALSRNYRLISLPTFGRAESTTRYLFKGLREVIAGSRFDLIVVESEPWAWVRWQAWWWKCWKQPHALFGEFSWENIVRPGWRGAILAAFYRAAVRTDDFVIAGSDDAGELFRRAGLPPSRLLIAPQLGVDEQLLQPLDEIARTAQRRREGASPTAFVIGFCGRFVEEKGVLDLVSAVDAVRARHPDLSVELVMLGAGPLRNVLQQLALGRPWLRLLPPRPHAEVGPFMQILDLFILPSKPLRVSGSVWEEQFGHVLIEAMACGVPCLGSDSGAIPQVVGVGLAVFPAGDLATLVEKIELVVQDGTARNIIAGTQRERVLNHYTNRAVAASWAGFLHRQRDIERSVLWIDPHLEFRSPTMQHLLYALPHLRAAGWEVEAWCLRSDAPSDEVRHTFLPAAKWLGPLELLYFTVVVNLYGLWRIVSGRPITATVIHATCGTYLGGNLVSVHFVNAVWAALQLKLGIHSAKEWAKFLFGLCGIVTERLSWWSPTLRKVLAVSESIADEVRRRSPTGLAVEVFPNSYDETRFHAGVRALYRERLREELGLAPEHFAFIFVSQGHHERKGFWLAVDALAQLRREGRKDLRFLVVGGSPQTLDALRARLATFAPDWAEWVLLVGMQMQVEKYYAAADAFLFPSYFEAFSLAEIEAAACGLPLLLTPHHGSEMTLKAGVPGVELSFDPVEMSRQIATFLDDCQLPSQASAGRGLNRRQYAEKLIAIYEQIRGLDQTASATTTTS